MPSFSTRSGAFSVRSCCARRRCSFRSDGVRVRDRSSRLLTRMISAGSSPSPRTSRGAPGGPSSTGLRISSLGQVDQFERRVAGTQQPFQKSCELHGTSARSPDDPSTAGRDRVPPKFLGLRGYVVPVRYAQVFVHPLRTDRRLRRIERPEAEVIEQGRDFIVSAHAADCLSEASGPRRVEHHMLDRLGHRRSLGRHARDDTS